jgi:uncharacterized membrane protein YdjX (TVP38/TMEM64 family)
MTVWDLARQTGWSTRAVIAAVVLAALLVLAVPAALFVGIILMVLGHVIGGLALFGGSILAAVAAVLTAAWTGVWRVRKALRQQPLGEQPVSQQQPYRVVQLGHEDYRYS